MPRKLSALSERIEDGTLSVKRTISVGIRFGRTCFIIMAIFLNQDVLFKKEINPIQVTDNDGSEENGVIQEDLWIISPETTDEGLIEEKNEQSGDDQQRNEIAEEMIDQESVLSTEFSQP